MEKDIKITNRKGGKGKLDGPKENKQSVTKRPTQPRVPIAKAMEETSMEESDSGHWIRTLVNGESIIQRQNDKKNIYIHPSSRCSVLCFLFLITSFTLR